MHREGNNVDGRRKSARHLTSELHVAALSGPYQPHSSVPSAAAPGTCNHRLGCKPRITVFRLPQATRPGQHAALTTIIQLLTWLYDYLKKENKYYMYVVLWLSLLQSHSIPHPTNIYFPAPDGKRKNFSDISNRR